MSFPLSVVRKRNVFCCVDALSVFVDFFPLMSQLSRKYFSVVRTEDFLPTYLITLKQHFYQHKTVGMRGREEWELAFNGYRVSVWEDEALETSGGDVYTTL